MSSNMSGGRDVPPVSGQIIWLRQIEGELEVSIIFLNHSVLVKYVVYVKHASIFTTLDVETIQKKFLWSELPFQVLM